MKNLNKTIFAVSILSTTILLSSCNNQESPNISKSETLINKISNNTLIIKKHFDAKNGLTGFIIAQKSDTDKTEIIYTTSNGEYLITGNILNIQSDNINEKQYNENTLDTSKIYKLARETNYFQQGNDTAEHKLYIVFDPNCIACHMAFDKLQTDIKSNKIAVRWIPVGMLSKSSANKAIEIISNKSPLTKMFENEKDFDTEKHAGGLKGIANPTKQQQDKLKENNNFALLAKINSVPAIIIKSPDGKVEITTGYSGESSFKNAGNSWD